MKRAAGFPECLKSLLKCRQAKNRTARQQSAVLSKGSIIGEELKSFGINMNFGPVLDINSNQNPVIGDKAFGATAEIVTKSGIETMKGLHTPNIISVVKHFPGHGDTSVDSHIGLPTVNHGLEG